jgi:hypothetical protein
MGGLLSSLQDIKYEYDSRVDMPSQLVYIHYINGRKDAPYYTVFLN